MKIKEANKITGGLTYTSKMPGPSYNTPASRCLTGAKLRTVPGSVCSSCYALKGNYTRYPAIKAAQYYRLQSLRDPQWVPQCYITTKNNVLTAGSKQGRIKYFS